MTNKEAANNLRHMIEFYHIMLRGNGKFHNVLKHIEALTKAVEVLEKTADEEE